MMLIMKKVEIKKYSGNLKDMSIELPNSPYLKRWQTLSRTFPKLNEL